MNDQIAHRLQAEEQAKEQCQSFQTDRQANQLAQPPHRQIDNIQHHGMLDQIDIQVIIKLKENLNITNWEANYWR